MTEHKKELQNVGECCPRLIVSVETMLQIQRLFGPKIDQTKVKHFYGFCVRAALIDRSTFSFFPSGEKARAEKLRHKKHLSFSRTV